MLELARNREDANLIIRVLVARPKHRWKGFVSLEKDSSPEPFAFVVDVVLPEPPTTARD